MSGMEDVPRVEGSEYGPGGGTIIFENERIRVSDVRLPPGGRSKLHTHDLDYVLIQIEGDKIAVEPHPETRSAYREYMEVDVAPGDFVFIEKGGVETAVNVGKKPWREICIELK